MKLIDRLFKRNNYPQIKHAIKQAFVSGGVPYYQLEDFNNTPALRGLKTMVFYEEMRMKCNFEFLKLHTEAIENILQPKPGKGINVYEIKKLNDQLKQRLDLALDTELLYKVASIVFFDKEENIEDYDFAYNLKKINHWKKHQGTDFFLQQPLQELLPVLKDISGNLKTYSLLVEQLNQVHLDSILPHLPEEKTKTLKNSSYLSVALSPQK